MEMGDQPGDLHEQVQRIQVVGRAVVVGDQAINPFVLYTGR
jgi:hypothetical protein